MATKNSTVNVQTDPVALSTMSVKSSEYPNLIFNRYSQSIAVMYMSMIYILKIYCIKTLKPMKILFGSTKYQLKTC